MDYRKFGSTWVIRMDRGEEIFASLKALCAKERIRLASVSALGACDRVKACVYDMENKVYHRQTLTGFMEMASLTGTVTEKDGEPYLHLHGVFCGEDLIARGGHIMEAVVSATCEMGLTEIPGRVGRAFQEETGLNLFRFDE